jgi:hypothetical protein
LASEGAIELACRLASRRRAHVSESIKISMFLRRASMHGIMLPLIDQEHDIRDAPGLGSGLRNRRGRRRRRNALEGSIANPALGRSWRPAQVRRLGRFRRGLGHPDQPVCAGYVSRWSSLGVGGGCTGKSLPRMIRLRTMFQE